MTIRRGANTKEHWEQTHASYSKNAKKLSEQEQTFAIEKWEFYYIACIEYMKHLGDVRKVLDLGCGIAENLAYFARNNPEWSFEGIDFTDSFLEHGKKYADLQNLKLYKQDVLEENFSLGYYDAIMVLETLEHFDQAVVSTLVETLLNKCKYLFITVPSDHNPCQDEHISFYELDSFDRYEVLHKDKLRHLLYFVIKGNGKP